MSSNFGPQGTPFPLAGIPALSEWPPNALAALLNHFQLPSMSNEAMIQPNLALAADVQTLSQRLAVVEAELAQLKRTRSDDAPDSDGDGATPRKRAKKSRSKSGPVDRVLSVPKENLTSEQTVVRAELRGHVKTHLMSLTGIQPNGMKGRDGRGDGDSDSDMEPVSDDETNSGAEKLRFDFTQDVTAAANEAVIQRAADLVWREQTDKDMRTLTHQNVSFTLKDLVAFGKDYFREWRRKHVAASDPVRAKKQAMKKAMNRRVQRQKMLQDDREKALATYQDKYKKDVAAVLEEAAWMSDELSGLDTDDESKRQTHRDEVAAAARLSKEDKDEGIPVWEVRRPAYRTQEVNDIIDELDRLRREQRKANGKARRVTTKRVNLGRLNQEPPAVPVYPFMLDTEWFKMYKASHPGEDIFAKAEDPEAFCAEDNSIASSA
ncbi:hypothetical protein FA95DRAFT_1573624 [Auriscalpium vulgare]|uniref:Uncharacterized protein n=1 Tax=Auriscalpium vulgare TaxID=40419 RepID=A0ACB8RNJ7_9AGAM|nr:hypothetical protein FA95DRAFT_1573624 [Auriscalpium vulgare]